jgi:Ubiquitin carboxyl-terminal hydrolase
MYPFGSFVTTLVQTANTWSCDPERLAITVYLTVRIHRSLEPVPPMMFVHRLRMLHPQFAQQSPRGGGFMQQDAEELYSALLNTLALNLKDVSGAKVNVDRYH